MTQKKIVPKKEAKRAQRVDRVERVEPLSSKNMPDRLLMIMKKKVTIIIPIGAIFIEKEIEKKGEATEISRPIPHEKLRRRNEKRLKGIFSSRSVDFFY